MRASVYPGRITKPLPLSLRVRHPGHLELLHSFHHTMWNSLSTLAHLSLNTLPCRAFLHDSWTMISFSLAGVSCPRMNAPARRPPPAANAAAAAASAAAGKTAGMSAASIVAGNGLPSAPSAGGGGAAANGSASAGSDGAGSPPPPMQPEPHAAEAKHFSEVREHERGGGSGVSCWLIL